MTAAPVRRILLVACLVGVVGCSSDAGGPPTTAALPNVVPDETVLAPGSCDPTQTVEAPRIEVLGQTVPATFGLGDFDCAGSNGDGYIGFNYNPVLLDGDGVIAVEVEEDLIATISFGGGNPFVESEPGRWTTSLDDNSCTRLTISLSSATDSSKATYGADIRVGGEGVPCPQREIDPSDPSDTGPIPTA